MKNIETSWLQFESAFRERIGRNSFIKITMSDYKGKDDLKNIYLKNIYIKGTSKLSFTYRYQTKDIVKNHDIAVALTQIRQNFGISRFNKITLFSLDYDEELNCNQYGIVSFKRRKPSQKNIPSTQHDNDKQRKINPQGKKYLQALKITDAEGKVYKKSQDKYRQINHYIEILSSTFAAFQHQETIHIADMGSGKGYLTFALYDYLNNNLNKNALITGVEFKQDMVDLCNKIALAAQFRGLRFEKSTIIDFEPKYLDILIALHACDTATDDAIAKGICHQAKLIVVAPCCHKQVRQAMQPNSSTQTIHFMTKYGLFLERQAEMLTDSVRTMILEYFGYQTKVVDFISDLHTPKNVLIIAQKKKNYQPIPKDEFIQQINDIKSFWGIEKHYLEELLF